jgi:hypothetical protein
MAGDISWEGPFGASGRYQFATHDGDIDVTLPASPDASFFVRSFEGAFRSAVPIDAPGAAGRRKRFRFALGSGAARVDLETFRGTISLRPAA